MGNMYAIYENMQKYQNMENNCIYVYIHMYTCVHINVYPKRLVHEIYVNKSIHKYVNKQTYTHIYTHI